MNLAPTADQAAIAGAIDRIIAKQFPMAVVRELGERSIVIDTGLWKLCAIAGWPGLGLSAAAGGSGLGPVEETLLFRRLGRHLVPGPFLGTVVAAHLAESAGDIELASTLATGDRRCGVAVGELGVDVELGDLVITFDGTTATLLEGVIPSPVRGVDAGTAVSSLSEGSPIAVTEDPVILARAHLLVAAAALGVIDAVCRMSAAHARERVQFGVPIGSFQAVKHRCADMAISAYAVGAQVSFAAHHLSVGHPAAAFQCASAHLLAVRSARRAVADNIQNLGAIGFTMEHDAHLYLRRAHTLENLLGPQRDVAAVVLAPTRHDFA